MRRITETFDLAYFVHVHRSEPSDIKKYYPKQLRAAALKTIFDNIVIICFNRVGNILHLVKMQLFSCS